MNKSPTMLAVSRQYVWIKMAKYIYKLFLGCWTHCYSILLVSRVVRRPGNRMWSITFRGRSGNYRIWRNLPSEKLRAKNAGFLLSLCFVFLKKSILFVPQNVQYWMKKMDAAQWTNQSSRGNVLCFYKLCLVLRIIAFVLFMHLSISSKTHRWCRWWEGKICSLL